MIKVSPYSTPKSSPELAVESIPLSSIELASRWSRLGAVLIDGVILITVILVIAAMFGEYSLVEYGTSEISSEYDHDSVYYQVEGESLFTEEVSFVDTMIYVCTAIMIDLILNGYLLIKCGQTIGKKILNIQVVCHDSFKLLSAKRIIGLRVLPIYLTGLVPALGDWLFIVDGIFIFGKKKRCIHDYVANSIVIKKIHY